MTESRLLLSQYPRPWYYQRWFLVVAFILGWPFAPMLFVLWPVWGALILRSPWHNGLLIKSLAWAMFFSGIVAIWWLLQSGTAGPNIGAFILPGLVLTAVTQVTWSRQRRKLFGVGEEQTQSAALDNGIDDSMFQKSHGLRSRRVRRIRRRVRRGHHFQNPK
jgi:hypothetical protein